MSDQRNDIAVGAYLHTEVGLVRVRNANCISRDFSPYNEEVRDELDRAVAVVRGPIQTTLKIELEVELVQPSLAEACNYIQKNPGIADRNTDNQEEKPCQ